MSDRELERRPVRRKILVVDDTPVLREIESLFLARVGQVLTANSGEEALTLAHSEHPDVVVADLGMPGMDGEEASRGVLEVNPDARIILCSGYTEVQVKRRAQDLGIAAFIQKPVRPVTLARAVHTALQPDDDELEPAA